MVFVVPAFFNAPKFDSSSPIPSSSDQSSADLLVTSITRSATYVNFSSLDKSNFDPPGSQSDAKIIDPSRLEVAARNLLSIAILT